MAVEIKGYISLLRRKQNLGTPPFPPPLPSLPSPTQELNFRQLSVPTTCQYGWCLQTQGMCNLRARLEERQTAYQPTLPWQTHYTQHATPSRHWDLHFASLQELGIWLAVPLCHAAALWKSIQPSLLSLKSLIPHFTDLLFMHIILSTALITSWDWEMQLCPELTSAWGRGTDHSRLSQFLGFWLGWFNAH